MVGTSLTTQRTLLLSTVWRQRRQNKRLTIRRTLPRTLLNGLRVAGSESTGSCRPSTRCPAGGGTLSGDGGLGGTVLLIFIVAAFKGVFQKRASTDHITSSSPSSPSITREYFSSSGPTNVRCSKSAGNRDCGFWSQQHLMISQVGSDSQ